MNKLETTVYARNKNLRPKLFVIEGDNVREFFLSGNQFMGRRTADNNPDINIPSGFVSRKHGLFVTSVKGTVYQDIGSSNGTIAGGRMLQKGMYMPLRNGEVLRIRARNASGTDRDVVLVFSTNYPKGSSWKKISLSGDIRSLEIGRADGRLLNDETASRKHATFFLAKNGWAIIDNNSRNGVFLNGKKITEPVLLRPMDIVSIANHLFVFRRDSLLLQADEVGITGSTAESLEGIAQDRDSQSINGTLWSPDAQPGESSPAEARNVSSGSFSKGGGAGPAKRRPDQDPVNVRPDGFTPGAGYPGTSNLANYEPPGRGGNAVADRMNPPQQGMPRRGKNAGKMLSIHIEERNVWNRLRKKTLLRNINLQIDSGSLVLILGGSGAGKTTFMNAVMGYEPAKGSIAYGKSDIYREYEKMKYEIGYVPQQDLLRMEDVVYDTLDNAAQMRLPDTIFPAEREKIVDDTLNMFGLSRERATIVGKLSGGQRKRLSIAVEYIGDPSLFFLDEPDSGLDGVMAKELFTNLRQIADQGKIVMVISHAPDRVFELFDKVIVLAKSAKDDSGNLVFYGAPADACRFFDTNSLEGIIGRINRKDEGGQGLADYYIDKFRVTGGR